MQSELKAGVRLQSTTCDTEIVVVRPPISPVELACGGEQMVLVGEPKSGNSPGEDLADGSLLGKRYTDEQTEIEVLCVKAGRGSLSVDGRKLERKGAKPLPSSD